MVASAYRGGAFSSEDSRYKKYTFDEMKDADLNKTTQGGWVAMLQHYFVSAWAPNANDTNSFYSRVIPGKDQAIIGYKAPLVDVAAGQQAEVSGKLWIGPKLQDQMAKVANHLDLTVDYGWLWFIAQPLHWLLTVFHGFVQNWGLAIIMLTLLVRGIMFPLTKAQYTSMAKMRMLQPKLAALKERFGDDRQKMSQGMMELYKKEKVNPLGGCLPILVQMPIFIALYWALMESVELRHAPFALWITDLSVKDPFFVLPILMGASMWYLQKMSPTTINGPDAAEGDAVHADHLHLHVPLVPGRSDSVLAGEQRHLHHPADHHLSSAGEERPALTQLMRSPSFLMTKEAAFGPPFLLQCPPPSYSFSQPASQAR